MIAIVHSENKFNFDYGRGQSNPSAELQNWSFAMTHSMLHKESYEINVEDLFKRVSIIESSLHLTVLKPKKRSNE